MRVNVMVQIDIEPNVDEGEEAPTPEEMRRAAVRSVSNALEMIREEGAWHDLGDAVSIFVTGIYLP